MTHCDRSSQKIIRKEVKRMSEKQKEIIKNLAEQLPKMTERERGYLEGTIATAAAMSKKDKEGEKNECVDPH